MSYFRRKVNISESIPEELPDNIIVDTYTNTSEELFAIPAGYKYMSMFLVGGGGSGAGHSGRTTDRAGCGGNGGEVQLYKNIPITGNTISIYCGNGGVANTSATSIGTSGGNTVLTILKDSQIISTYTALGGSAGQIIHSIYDNKNWIETLQNKGNLGGVGTTGTELPSNGYKGVKCPFLEEDKYYGASGGGGCNAYRGSTTEGVASETGGGLGGYGSNNAITNTGGDATFYGGGGGGGAFNSSHNTGNGGNGYQGICIICYHNNLLKDPDIPENLIAINNSDIAYIDTGLALCTNSSNTWEIKVKVKPYSVGKTNTTVNYQPAGSVLSAGSGIYYPKGVIMIYKGRNLQIDTNSSSYYKYTAYNNSDGTMELDITSTYNPTTHNINCTLFSAYDSADYMKPCRFMRMDLYYCKIFLNGELVRDFIPKYIDNKVGLYDQINDKFYTSPNGCEFNPVY